MDRRPGSCRLFSHRRSECERATFANRRWLQQQHRGRQIRVRLQRVQHLHVGELDAGSVGANPSHGRGRCSERPGERRRSRQRAPVGSGYVGQRLSAAEDVGRAEAPVRRRGRVLCRIAAHHPQSVSERHHGPVGRRAGRGATREHASAGDRSRRDPCPARARNRGSDRQATRRVFDPANGSEDCGAGDTARNAVSTIGAPPGHRSLRAADGGGQCPDRRRRSGVLSQYHPFRQLWDFGVDLEPSAGHL